MMWSNVDEPMICNPLVVYEVYLLRKLTFSGDHGFVATLSKHPVNANEDNCLQLKFDVLVTYIDSKQHLVYAFMKYYFVLFIY